MSQENDPNNNPTNRLNLDLSLGIVTQEQDPVGGPVEDPAEDPVEGQQGQFTQLLRSVSDPQQNVQPYPPPTHHMMPPGNYNTFTTPWDISAAALLPSPPVGNLQSSWPIHPVALDTPRTAPRLGRPPAGSQVRRNSSRAVAVEKAVGDKEISSPFPWATTKPAMIHNIIYLLSKNIDVISGQVHCRPCDRTITLEYKLSEKFKELSQYIEANKDVMRHRAPNTWMNPKLTPCSSCESGMKPVISEKKEEINWLFLLLGQMLGSCTLEQLRYFCDKTHQHRTGAKDRVLYLTYLGLYKQLKPSG